MDSDPGKAPTLDEMVRFAECVARLAAAPDTLAMDAAAHLVLNRRAKAASHRARTGRAHREFGDGRLLDACLSLEGGTGLGEIRLPSFSDPQFARAFARCCLALHGETSDPTGGALFRSDHASADAAARGHRATALIGHHLFMRPRA